MAFTDVSVVVKYPGPLTVGSGDAGAPAYYWKLNQPTDSNGTPWPIGSVGSPGELVVELWDGTLTYRTLGLSEYMYMNGFLYVYPASIASWTNVSNYSLTLFRRPAAAQNYLGAGQLALSPQAIAAQLDQTTRLAEIAYEMANRSLQCHPLDQSYDVFSGQNLHPSKLTLPPISQRAFGIVGFDASGTTLVVYQGAPSTLASVTPVASTVAVRDANGRTQVNDPAGALDVANKEYVDALKPGLMQYVGTALTGNSLAVVAAAARSGIWTFASGATSTPEGTATGTWYYFYHGDGSNGFLSGWKSGTLPSEQWAVNLTGGVWGTWMRTSTPPVGRVEFQGPADATPASLYPGTTWTDVSAEEADTSRRVVGAMAGSFPGVTPAQFTVSVSGGVPTVTIAYGGLNYLSGGSGTVSLIITGNCTTQMKATATVTSGALTAINVTQAGAGYTSGNVGVYDQVTRFAGTMIGHYHGTTVTISGGGSSMSATTSSYLFQNIGQAASSDGSHGDPVQVLGPENTTPWTPVKKWRRTA